MRQYRLLKAALAITLLAPWSGAPPVAYALPTGGASSTAAISAIAGEMTIGSNVAENLITWQDFSVGSTEKVNFLGSNTYLNFVIGSLPSAIYGEITGEAASVCILNPHGIIIGDGAIINVGSLTLSTAAVDKTLQDFAAVKNALDSPLTLVGDVINKGQLTNANLAIAIAGKNVSIKRLESVTVNGTINSPQVKITAAPQGEIHIGYDTPPVGLNYTMNLPSDQIIGYQLIKNRSDFQKIDDNDTNLASNYMLANDLDNVGDIALSGKFKGRFDGLGYVISGFNVVSKKGKSSNMGLFANNTDSGIIENVGVVNASIQYKYSNNVNVGGLVGDNQGTIRNVYFIGDVEGTSTGGVYANVGGLVGSNGGSIINSYHVGKITATGATAYAGGIAGFHTYKPSRQSTIANTYHSDLITATGNTDDNAFIGGIVGHSSGGVTDSYTDFGEDAKDLKSAATFVNWNLDIDGTKAEAVWRIYEGYTAPLLKYFLAPKILPSATVNYDGEEHTLTVDTAEHLWQGEAATGTEVGVYQAKVYSDQDGYDLVAPTLTILPPTSEEIPPVDNAAPENSGELTPPAAPPLAQPVAVPEPDKILPDSNPISEERTSPSAPTEISAATAPTVTVADEATTPQQPAPPESVSEEAPLPSTATEPNLTTAATASPEENTLADSEDAFPSGLNWTQRPDTYSLLELQPPLPPANLGTEAPPANEDGAVVLETEGEES
ncbi:MAG: filamentous hemagglutinin N-terminal domain-containing protein [Selenomonadaceae bacterium]|nr:filamentous hemagglutinin N-terminal domain-containing protein [Selenomonadaceae bacterium]